MLSHGQDGFGRILDEQELSRSLPGAPELNGIRAGLDSLDALTDKCGDDVRLFEVEMIARAVEIGDQGVDRIEPVLLAIGPRHYDQHLFRETIRRIGLFWVAIPEFGF